MAPLDNFTLKQGDSRPKLVAILKDKDGAEAIDLTTASKVFFIMREVGKTDEDGPKIREECDITDGANGIVTYTWKTGNTDTVGTFQGEFEIEWEDGGIETVPNSGYFPITITDDLG